VVSHPNSLTDKNSFWAITMNDMMWDGDSVFKTYHS
jgi:hypothetical protein